MSSKYSAEQIKVIHIDDEVYENLDFSRDNALSSNWEGIEKSGKFPL